LLSHFVSLRFLRQFFLGQVLALLFQLLNVSLLRPALFFSFGFCFCNLPLSLFFNAFFFLFRFAIQTLLLCLLLGKQFLLRFNLFSNRRVHLSLFALFSFRCLASSARI